MSGLHDAVTKLLDAWAAIPAYTATDYDRGRVDQRHMASEELAVVLEENSPTAAISATSAAGSSPEDAGKTGCGLCDWSGPPANGCPHTAEERADQGLATLAEIRARLDGDWPVYDRHVRFLLGRLAAAEQEAAGLREQVAAVAALHGATHWCFGGADLTDLRDDVVFEPDTEHWPCPTAAALADPVSVLARRDAEVGAKAVGRLASDLATLCDRWDALTKGPSPTTLAIRAAIERAGGPREGVDRG